MRHLFTKGPCDHEAVKLWLGANIGRVLRDFEHNGRRHGAVHSHFVVQTPADTLGPNFSKLFRTVYPIGGYASKAIKDTAQDLANVLFYLERNDCGEDEEPADGDEEPGEGDGGDGQGNDDLETEFWIRHQDRLTDLARALRGQTEAQANAKLVKATLYIAHNGRKITVGELHAFCASNNLTDRSAFDRHPESACFLGLYGLNGHLTNIFGMVTAAGIESHVKYAAVPEDIESALILYPEVSRIYKYLTEIQAWSPEQTYLFGNVCFDVANRRSGKKNTVWISGVSNAGKSRIMDAFISGYFNGNVGLPDNTPKTSFKWGGCVNKRVIMWDEPFALQEEAEVLKLILGGEPANVQVKYQTSTFINPTPVFVTSNKKIHEILRIEWQAARNVYDNRMFTFRMQQACPPTRVDDFFPLTKADWDQFGYVCELGRPPMANKRARVE